MLQSHEPMKKKEVSSAKSLALIKLKRVMVPELSPEELQP